MSAPVPAASDAVRSVICPPVVISPVLVGHGYGRTQLIVEADLGCHLLRDVDAVLLVSEQVDGRTFCLLSQSFSLCGLSLFFCLGFQGWRLAVYAVLESLAAVG